MRRQLVTESGAGKSGPKVTFQCCIVLHVDKSTLLGLRASHNVLDLCRVEDEVRASRRRVEDHQKHQRKTRVAIRAAEKAAPELADGEGLAVEEEPAGAEPLMSEQWAAEEPDADDEPVHHRVFFPNPVKGPCTDGQGWLQAIAAHAGNTAACADQAWVA